MERNLKFAILKWEVWKIEWGESIYSGECCWRAALFIPLAPSPNIPPTTQTSPLVQLCGKRRQVTQILRLSPNMRFLYLRDVYSLSRLGAALPMRFVEKVRGLTGIRSMVGIWRYEVSVFLCFVCPAGAPFCFYILLVLERFCFAFKGPKRPKGPHWVQLMNLAQASLMSFFSLTPKIIQVRICQDKQISDKRSAQLWGMLQFEFSFLICPDALDALNARARWREPHGHNRRQEHQDRSKKRIQIVTCPIIEQTFCH